MRTALNDFFSRGLYELTVDDGNRIQALKQASISKGATVVMNVIVIMVIPHLEELRCPMCEGYMSIQDEGRDVWYVSPLFYTLHLGLRHTCQRYVREEGFGGQIRRYRPRRGGSAATRPQMRPDSLCHSHSRDDAPHRRSRRRPGRLKHPYHHSGKCNFSKGHRSSARAPVESQRVGQAPRSLGVHQLQGDYQPSVDGAQREEGILQDVSDCAVACFHPLIDSR
jgi:hypothetical protein